MNFCPYVRGSGVFEMLEGIFFAELLKFCTGYFLHSIEKLKSRTKIERVLYNDAHVVK